MFENLAVKPLTVGLSVNCATFAASSAVASVTVIVTSTGDALRLLFI